MLELIFLLEILEVVVVTVVVVGDVVVAEVVYVISENECFQLVIIYLLSGSISPG